jgi:hypothetical protein
MLAVEQEQKLWKVLVWLGPYGTHGPNPLCASSITTSQPSLFGPHPGGAGTTLHVAFHETGQFMVEFLLKNGMTSSPPKGGRFWPSLVGVKF